MISVLYDKIQRTPDLSSGVRCVLYVSTLSGDDLHRNVEDFGNLYQRVDMPAGGLGKVVRRSALAPAVYKFACTAAETDAVIGISDGKDFAVNIFSFRNDEFEVSVAVLRTGKIGDRPEIGLKL